MKKTNHHYRTPAARGPMYPNAADANYFSRKASEILTAIVSGMGVLTGMVFLVIIA